MVLASMPLVMVGFKAVDLHLFGGVLVPAGSVQCPGGSYLKLLFPLKSSSP